MIDTATSEKDLHAINQLLALTAIMLVFVIGLLAHYLFDLVYKSIDTPHFFCQFSCSRTTTNKAGVTDSEHNLDHKDIGAGGDTTVVTIPPTTAFNNNSAKVPVITAGECSVLPNESEDNLLREKSLLSLH